MEISNHFHQYETLEVIKTQKLIEKVITRIRLDRVEGHRKLRRTFE